jgi:hypothetical protein
MGGIAFLLSGNNIDGLSFKSISQNIDSLSNAADSAVISGASENMHEAFSFFKTQSEKLLSSH